MAVQKEDYEELLSIYSSIFDAIELLRLHRPYLELMPSMRRSEESLITMPLPIVKLRKSQPMAGVSYGGITVSETIQLPCDVALLMCDPEWKIKTGREIFVFIHRPDEDLSDLLSRWRQTQVLLATDYEWIFPLRYQHMLNEGADKIYPLFVLFNESPERIRRGLIGANLPFVIQTTIATQESIGVLDESPQYL
ncbi:MAG: hypothetical protein LH631_04135 [Alkalinema sp. CAN_BIN05]|nr:hypothetical protein [Alkalinema sp. CAN_BIN05]